MTFYTYESINEFSDQFYHGVHTNRRLSIQLITWHRNRFIQNIWEEWYNFALYRCICIKYISTFNLIIPVKNSNFIFHNCSRKSLTYNIYSENLINQREMRNISRTCFLCLRIAHSKCYQDNYILIVARHCEISRRLLLCYQLLRDFK
jgi:hypothetical protein